MLPTTTTVRFPCPKCSRLPDGEWPIFCAACAQLNWKYNVPGCDLRRESLQNPAWLEWQFRREESRRLRVAFGIRPAVLDKSGAKRRTTVYKQRTSAITAPGSKRALRAAYKTAGIKRARDVRPEHETLIAGGELARNPDEAKAVMDRERRTGERVFEDQILLTATQAGQPGVEAITLEQYQRDPQAGRAELPEPPLTFDNLPDGDLDDTDDEDTIEDISPVDLIPDDVSEATQVDGEDAPANWELERGLTPFDQLHNTGMCTECGKRPAEAKGICSACRKSLQRARLRRANRASAPFSAP